MKSDTIFKESKLRKVRLCLIAILQLLLVVSAWQPGQSAELKPGVLRVGFTKSCFQGVNKNDAEASFKAFLTTVGRQRGYWLESSVEIFEDLSDFETAIKNGKISLAVVDAWQTLSFDIFKLMDPCFVPMPRDKVGRYYVILTRRGSHFDTLESLKGQDMVRLETGAATIGRPWLETLLLERGLEPQDRFFDKIEVVGKPSLAVLPVFFGTRQSCLVDMSGFDIMKELNPQLGLKLKVIAASEPCIESIIFLAKQGWSSEERRQEVIQSLADLHREPAGQQILTIFKVARLAPFHETQLVSVKKLRATYDRLQKRGQP